MERLLLCILLFLGLASARIHKTVIKDDNRGKFVLSSFGYLKDGMLTVKISDFSIASQFYIKNKPNGKIGLTLSRSKNVGEIEYLQSHSEQCVFDRTDLNSTSGVTFIMFSFFLHNNSLSVKRTGGGVNKPELKYVKVTQQTADTRKRREVGVPGLLDAVKGTLKNASKVASEAAKAGIKGAKKAVDATKVGMESVKNASKTASESAKAGLDSAKDASKGASGVVKSGVANVKNAANQVLQVAKNVSSSAASAINSSLKSSKHSACLAADDDQMADIEQGLIPLSMHTEGDLKLYSFVFTMKITDKKDQGRYALYFHNCLNSEKSRLLAVNFTAEICERNGENFLSAGQVPLPIVYFLLCVVFAAVGAAWLVTLLRANQIDVYKLHYIMLTVIWVKSLSLMFHAINFYFINKEGIHEEAWAVLYYIVHLVRGALLFSTIVLIGAGWIFLRHILSTRVKKLFLVIIPLQILSNVATIILEEKEESAINFSTWRQVFILVDLLCCGAILFPVVWSIRHLQEGAQVDGKEAVNLVKLKLFRHFYIMVVCYIYFTRIMVYLLTVSVPFHLLWLSELFKEAGTLAFFIMTGVKFQPADNNPYLQVPQDSDDETEMEEVVTTTGETESLRRVNRRKSDDDDNQSTHKETSLEFD